MRASALLLLGWLLGFGTPAGAGPLLHNATGVAPPEGGAFTLDGPDGPLALADLRGRVVLLYFGYTRCPDVCPMGLEAVARVMRRLEGEGERVQPLFVTLDPRRDRGEHLWNYVRFFHPRLLALRGEPEALERVTGRYGVRHQRHHSGSAAGYQIAHTDYLYLIDGAGRLRGIYDSFAPADEIAGDIRALFSTTP